MTRTMKGLTRAQTLTFLTHTLSQATRIIGDDINHITHPSDVPAIDRLIIDLEASLTGLGFIKQTYATDRTFNCAIDELTEETAQHLINFRCMMEARKQSKLKLYVLHRCSKRLNQSKSSSSDDDSLAYALTNT